jgi:tRNA (cytidine/uridine-2'-O-)-methyltransferase
MYHVALYQPEIPPNTGNIIRLCANTGTQLHLIYPLGFNPTDKQLKRAGLDYHLWTAISHYENFDSFLAANKHRRIFACTTKTQNSYSAVQYQKDDLFLFGPETRGLPADVLSACYVTQAITIPMVPQSRSLNLSNSVAVIIYEAWRQLAFSYDSEIN